MVTEFLVKTPEKAFKISRKMLRYHVNFTHLLEQFDRGEIFDYTPMQETKILENILPYRLGVNTT